MPPPAKINFLRSKSGEAAPAGAKLEAFGRSCQRWISVDVSAMKEPRKNLCEMRISGFYGIKQNRLMTIYGPVTGGFCFVSQRNVPQCEPEINQKQNYENGVAKRKFSNGAEQNTNGYDEDIETET